MPAGDPDIARFEESLVRTPALRTRLFTKQEQGRPVASLAARFAAKEALAKALGAPTGMNWLDAEVVNETSGKTTALFRCTQLVLYPKAP